MDEQVVPTFYDGVAQHDHFQQHALGTTGLLKKQQDIDINVLKPTKTVITTTTSIQKATKLNSNNKDVYIENNTKTSTTLTVPDKTKDPLSSPSTKCTITSKKNNKTKTKNPFVYVDTTPEKQERSLSVPPSEYGGKLRWQTPSRTGKWKESWHSAIQLCPYSLHSPDFLKPSISAILRTTLSKAVVTYVGPLLPTATVYKWLCLLCEYLELNSDEEILVICLLRRYARIGGQFVSLNDWARPQKWECVIAIACYLAVLLTEEFPGRTALDLKELLGSGFKFGCEQVAFLKCIDWRICITSEEINDVLNCSHRCVSGDISAYEEMDQWFSCQTRDVSDAKKWNNKKTNSNNKKQNELDEQVVVPVSVPAVVVAEKEIQNKPINIGIGKKRSFDTIQNNTSTTQHVDDSIVPRYVIRKIDPHLNVNHPSATSTAPQQQTFIQTVPHPLGGFINLPTTAAAAAPTANPNAAAYVQQGLHHNAASLHMDGLMAMQAAAGMSMVPFWGSNRVAPPPPGAQWPQ